MIMKDVCKHYERSLGAKLSQLRTTDLGEDGFSSGHTEFEVPVRHSRGDVRYALRLMDLELKTMVWVGYSDLGIASIQLMCLT